jgi:mono/diheme cytochrome c family protein
MMRRNLKTKLATVVAVAVISATAASANPNAAASPQAEAAPVSAGVSGADEFQRYCALCHGPDGRGVGPLSDAMKKSAADLSQISKHNGGHFPFSKVAATIRDGGGVAEHDTTRMPAWGKVLSADSDPVRAKAIIFEITQYVEALQEK